MMYGVTTTHERKFLANVEKKGETAKVEEGRWGRRGKGRRGEGLYSRDGLFSGLDLWSGSV